MCGQLGRGAPAPVVPSDAAASQESLSHTAQLHDSQMPVPQKQGEVVSAAARQGTSFSSNSSAAGDTQYDGPERALVSGKVTSGVTHHGGRPTQP